MRGVRRLAHYEPPGPRYTFRLKMETYMTTERSKSTDEAHIRQLIETRVKAIHAKEINAVMSNHAPDVLSFDALNPLQ